mmetsp:Transcript_30458/g.96861  ORF Transcript_30458/g.96861 Transcript_30458/m.96861 type:complete len:397 (+) Transcript_30458:3-1193(+)
MSSVPFISQDGVLDAAALGERMGKEVVEASIRDQEKMGGLSGEFKFIDVVLASGEKLALVLKSAAENALGANRVTMGCSREAFFYREFGDELAEVANLPRCFYADGCLETGALTLLLECLEGAVPSGVFFGPGNPNNWGVKDKLAEMCVGNPSAQEVTDLHFALYARLHAAYWQSAELLEKPWLRATDWMRGEGEASWNAAQEMARGAWGKCKAAIDAGEAPIQWDAHVVACLDVSFARATWENYQAELKTRPFSLVHGDAHPHNALWVEQRTERARLALIDFEMVGVGSPSQELGQYVISHMTPEVRRDGERARVERYHAELHAALHRRGLEAEASAFGLEASWAEYIAGGFGRWAWFLPLFMLMPQMAQFFHDQLSAFAHDHLPDASTAPMPRV